MSEECFVSVSIRGSSPDSPSRESELGEFSAFWKNGVTIGSDPRCTIVLHELAPVAACLTAGSNHKFLHYLPEGASLPLEEHELYQSDVRVDYNEFQIGPYWICFGEVYREE
jgi:hypothetical protein